MIVLSHRGYWKTAAEKNRAEAFRRSFDLGIGTETDVRDSGGRLVIAHDMPRGGEMTLAELLDLMRGRNLPLAINIKSDGLAEVLRAQMQAAGHGNWFTFDMSVPDMIVQLRLGLPAFTRASEFELPPSCYDKAQGVWLDAFESEWYSPEDIGRYLEDGKRVCVVSPELHGRDPLPLWRRLAKAPFAGDARLLLCTDRPEEAGGIMAGTS